MKQLSIKKELSHAYRKQLLYELFGYYLDDDGIVYNEDGDVLKIEQNSRGENVGHFKTLEDFFKYQEHTSLEFGKLLGEVSVKNQLKELLT